MSFFDKNNDADKTKTEKNESGPFLPIGTYLASKQYRITKHLGEGGFGKTYLVENSFGKQYVIKEFYIADICSRANTGEVTVTSVTKQQLFKDQRKKFRDEACRLNEFNHPNIVKVSALFEENDTSYYVMDYIDGMSLAQKIKKGKLTEQQILKYLDDILNALDYIHEKGVVHYDLKPGNIMLDKNDNAVLIDFGSSKHFNTQSLNETYMGTSNPPFTPGFAPFEQIHGKKEEMGRHSDIYALGATLYKMYTRKNPPSLNEVASQGIPEVPNASPLMQSIIKKAMAFVAKDRIKSVAEFRTMLNGKEPTHTSGATVMTKPATDNKTVVVEKYTSQIKKHLSCLSKRNKIIIGAAIIALVAIIAIANINSNNEIDGPSPTPSDTIPPVAHDTISPAPKVKEEPQNRTSILANGDTAIISPQGDTIEIRKIPFKMFTVNGITFKMIRVVEGTFKMGAQSTDPNGENYDSKAWKDEQPVHSVTLDDYYIGETEVTQELWEAVMGTTIEQQRQKAEEDRGAHCVLYGQGATYPMYYISWNDCQEFIKKLNQLTGKRFCLPTEAEWEYAARGGNKSRGYKYAGSNTIGDVAWYSDNAYDVGESSPAYGTHPVGIKLPNELGLYDMSGNVEEWCSDWYGEYSSSSQTNPTGPTSGSFRVNRGGCCNDLAFEWLCRVSNRNGGNPDSRDFGFRLALRP